MLGYKEFRTKEFVEKEEAFEYAFDKVTTDEEEREQFFKYIKQLFEDNKDEKALFVDWFFSGNWIRVEKE